MENRWLALGVALVVAAYASASIAVGTWFEKYPRLTRIACQWLVCDSQILLQRARQELWRAGPQEADAQEPLFQEALARDPASPYRWSDLADSYTSAGRLEQARYCHQQSVERGPNTPRILLRAANFLYAHGESDRALRLTARALALSRDYDQAIFRNFTRLGIPAGDILRRGMPRDGRAAPAYFRHLIEAGSLSQLALVWDWLRENSLANRDLLRSYVDWLLGARQYEAASKVLAEYAHRARNHGYKGNRVFNASFEREPTGTALDWNITPDQHAEASWDVVTAFEGSRSLKVQFDGEANIAYRHVYQKVVVNPGRMRFRAAIRARGLTTDQGVGFRIYDAERQSRVDLRTKTVSGTCDWKTLETMFSVPRHSRLLQIQLVRQPSSKFDNKLAGTVWIDDISLVSEN